MSIIFLLIPLSLVLAAGFLCAFIWAVRTGQYEDTYTPSIRLLAHDSVPPRRPGSSTAPIGAPKQNGTVGTGQEAGGPAAGRIQPQENVVLRT